MKLKFWFQDGGDFYTYDRREDADIGVNAVVHTFPEKVGDFDEDAATKAYWWFRRLMRDQGFETVQMEV